MDKPIIIGIDFSKGSIHALHYAMKIAQVIKTEIIAIWVGKPGFSHPIFGESISDPRQEVRKRFDDMETEFKKAYPNVMVTFKIKSGKVYTEIINQAKSKNAYLVIAGSHGVSGFEEYWIGSNAYKIVTSSTCPVITVHKSASLDHILKKIVLPITDTGKTLKKVDFTVELAKFFNAEIHLLSLYSSPLSSMKKRVDNSALQAEKKLNNENINFVKFSKQAENLTNETLKYANEVSANLISITTEQESSSSNVLLGANSQQLVNHSTIPVLTIRSK